MKIYYKVIHLFFTKQADHIHFFGIGIYDSKEKALSAVDALKTKEGFASAQTNSMYTGFCACVSLSF